MDVKEFEYLIAIAETHSVTKAAAKLYVTQSALSKFVQKNIQCEEFLRKAIPF